MSKQTNENGLRIALISLHGLIRADEPELGRDADTGGQIKYVLELAAELDRHDDVRMVELFTRQIIDDRVGPAYSQVEEPISGSAKIVRLPFGPKRYIKKEGLWPIVDIFVDQALSYFKRTGLPDLIHGHYADGGYAGAQLARLLGIPFAFTGHSLGRVKRERMATGKTPVEELDRKYRFGSRIEAEEISLETASLVVASTYQEVEDQYQKYHHYVPDRMEVIPPGVDLTAFHPASDADSADDAASLLEPFFRDSSKPIILTMARPDARKNLEMLVRVYGESSELQALANLVVVMGTRDDLRELASAQRKILLNVLTLIDVYNLYGKVAYPKQHAPHDVPALYRLAAKLKGVFINPALTEPFGLTLLEAAASGVPIVATNDGGPRDIIANCQNGLLVDPLNPEMMEQALLRVLTQKDEWQDWSDSGTKGAREYYSWNRHVHRYLRDVKEILSHERPPALATSTTRRLPEFDRLIITDLDNTLTGDDEGLREFIDLISQNKHVGFGIATGRKLDDALQLVEELGLPIPDLLNTSVGTAIHYGAKLHPDHSWRQQINHQWNAQGVHEVLDSLPGLFPQPAEKQDEFKISYELDPKIAPKISTIKKKLREAGLQVKVILSLKMFLDIVPVRAGSGLSMRHFLYKWGFSPEQVLVAGDSGNDEEMLKGRTLGVVVGNHGPELEKLRKLPRIYFAEACHARGIIEGIHYYHFLDNIVIPNDRND
ncbi:MAG: HAD-IIB family hydrolase [Pirellulaceae bacterium]